MERSQRLGCGRRHRDRQFHFLGDDRRCFKHSADDYKAGRRRDAFSNSDISNYLHGRRRGNGCCELSSHRIVFKYDATAECLHFNRWIGCRTQRRPHAGQRPVGNVDDYFDSLRRNDFYQHNLLVDRSIGKQLRSDDHEARRCRYGFRNANVGHCIHRG